ncbi:alkene reductase [Tautonia sociabilis]|uniref:Alkene reductase n=1 Tax=Tautonia sociabilis TaxID=2080755 RepID=A0A432MGQ9_9BACT|nr:alkene reductase [Tautonia sociabilis]RUL85708.1 alkene reductase [Tautonia sociabilis]
MSASGSSELRLMEPCWVGPYRLPNRVVMAPLTRCRAGAGNVPGPMNATYYAQRSGAGLIVSEATQVDPTGQGYPMTPGIHAPEQVAGWRLVTDAVHDRGGRIFLQLWHVGRISHPDFQPGGALPVAPSAIAPRVGMVTTFAGPKPFETPRALEEEEIPGIVEMYRRGARLAMDAGFDGVEIHGANGYLLDQFLRDGTNRRTDVYGGPPENRARLLLEVVEAVAGVWGAGRVGVRLSPNSTFNDMSDSDPEATFGYAVDRLDEYGLAYLHLVETLEKDVSHGARSRLDAAFFRPRFRNPIIANGGYDRDRAEAVLRAGHADLVSFGVLFLANPDLPERLRLGAPLNEPDPSTFYGGGERGYIDYPAMEPAGIGD